MDSGICHPHMCICVSFSYWFSRFIKEWYMNANQFVFECSGLVALYLERRCMYYPCVCILIILYIIRPLLFCYSSQTHIIVCLSVRVCMCVCVSVCIQMRKPDTNILLCVVFMAGVCICRYFFFLYLFSSQTMTTAACWNHFYWCVFSEWAPDIKKTTTTTTMMTTKWRQLISITMMKIM